MASEIFHPPWWPAEAARLGIEVETASTPAQRQENVMASRRRALPGLPRIQGADIVHVVGNGPSAAGRIPPAGEARIFVNGAGRLALADHSYRDYWLVHDPAPHVADFFRDLPVLNLTFLVATRCDPAVFKALELQHVRMFHVVGEVFDDPQGRLIATVPSMPSAVLAALWAAWAIGYRRATAIGWDCCLMDGRRHAVEQDQAPEALHRRLVGNRMYETTGTLLLEAHCALHYLPLMPGWVRIRGPGMLAALLIEAERERFAQQP